MLAQPDSIDQWKSALVRAFNWTLLAAFVMFPGTFASLSRVGPFGLQPGRVLGRAYRNTTVLWLAVICSTVGLFFIALLWWNARHNLFWITCRILL